MKKTKPAKQRAIQRQLAAIASSRRRAEESLSHALTLRMHNIEQASNARLDAFLDNLRKKHQIKP